jgi:acyl-CoA synthetase (AMP-forming)/AMP-acid ligase II
VVWDPAVSLGRAEGDALAEVIARARGLLAAYKVPRRWLSVEEIPLTPNGKPDRRGLARLAAAKSRSTAEITGSGAAAPEGGTDGFRA